MERRWLDDVDDGGDDDDDDSLHLQNTHSRLGSVLSGVQILTYLQ